MVFQLYIAVGNNCWIVKFTSSGFTEANQARLGLALGFRVRVRVRIRIRVTGFRVRVRAWVWVRIRVRVWSISGFSATGDGVAAVRVVDTFVSALCWLGSAEECRTKHTSRVSSKFVSSRSVVTDSRGMKLRR